MREKHFLAGCIGICCLLYFMVITGNLLTAYNGAEQYQAVVGNLYRENPEAAKKLLFVTFDSARTQESMQNGLRAAKEFGYTKDAYRVYYRQGFPVKLWAFVFAGSFVLLCLLCVLIRRQRFFDLQKIVNLTQRLQEYENGTDIFDIGRRTEGPWLSLEYHILQLTELKEKQQAYFTKRQEQMQMFMENIAHQVKTPLSCILLNLELLQNKMEQRAAGEDVWKDHFDSAGDVPRNEFNLIQDSVSQGERIRRLLLQLLNLARLEAGKVHFHMEQVSVEELLCEVQASFSDGTVLVQGDSLAGREWLWGDRYWLFEAIFNLVDNSVKYAGDTPIEIGVQRGSDNIRFMVQDFGRGLSKEELQHIFERYYMGDTADGYQTGIGLNLSKYVIEGHHGTLRADSTEGRGTTMEISLPRFRWKEKITV